MARPSKFNTALSEKIVSLYEEGKTDDQVAEIIGVSVRTLFNWKAKHPEFVQSIRESKQAADELVEASLFSRALGYSFEEEKIFCTKDGEIVRAKTIRHIPPDVKAQIFWLMNRQRDQWSVLNPNGPADKSNKEQSNAPKVIVSLPSNGRENTAFSNKLTEDLKDVTPIKKVQDDEQQT